MSTQPIDISYRHIAWITAPVLINQLSHTAMGVIDTVMVGSLGVTALAAVGLGNFVAWWLLAFVVGMLSGVNTLVAQAEGAKQPRKASVALWQGLYMGLMLALVFLAIYPATPWLLGLAKASPEATSMASRYMQIRMLTGVGFAFLLASDNFYRGLARTRILMWAGLGQLVINCGLNYVLIFGKLGAPQLGTEGAAWGTVFSQLLVGGILFASILTSRDLRQGYGVLETWRFDPPVFRKLVTLSIPIGVQYFMEMGGITVFCALVARLGDAEMAATNAVIQAWSFAFLGAVALSISATTLVGQCIGAGRPEDGRLAVHRVLHFGLGYSAVLGFVYIFFPELLMSIFVGGDDLQRLLPFARPLFTVVVVCLVFDLLFIIFSGALRGAGDTRYPMLVNIGSAWLLFVPATLLVTPVFGLIGAWSCLIVHVMLMAGLLYRRFRGNAWIRGSLVSPETREKHQTVAPEAEGRSEAATEAVATATASPST